ncbi:MAG: hypothetical protein EXS42_05420 [Lacunisphaera sp.]|nr:hypothetical protein [Lacunisphaera sp.]
MNPAQGYVARIRPGFLAALLLAWFWGQVISVSPELGYRAGAFPQAEQAARSILSLPMFPEMNRAQCDYACESLRAALG